MFHRYEFSTYTDNEAHTISNYFSKIGFLVDVDSIRQTTNLTERKITVLVHKDKVPANLPKTLTNCLTSHTTIY